MTILDIFVPNLEPVDGLDREAAAQRWQVRTIDPKSGIVGRRARGRQADRHGAFWSAWLLDYEGNRYGASNMRTWGDRVYHAASRASQDYPTTARCLAQPAHLIRVGTIVMDPGPVVSLTADGRDAVAAWLGIPPAAVRAQQQIGGPGR